MIRELILKDLEQNRNALALYLLAGTLFPLGAHLFQKSKSAESYLGIVFGLVIMGAPLLFSFWFVGQEKMKGTLRFLRVLPIRETSIVIAKLGLSASLTLVMLLLVLVVVPAVLRATGQSNLAIGALPVLWLMAASILCCIVCTCVFIAFDHKLAMQIGYGIMAAMAGASVLGSKFLDGGSSAAVTMKAALAQPVFPVAVLLALVPAAALAVRFGARLLEWRDWSELEED